jgi:hypothetical protein
MEHEKALQNIPKEGFLKLTKPAAQNISASQKTALIRKGNELFNNKQFEQAKKIFLTTGYTDGISRIGDYYYKKNEVLEALRMYVIAPAPDKKERLIERMAHIVQTWLHEKS